ncbi:hypothetical protein ABPG74_017725 [Tetrahymena malaccensis]
MGKSKTPKGQAGLENGGGSSYQPLCNVCQSNNPINLVCTDQKCSKQEQLQAICATCHYSLYHSSVSLETYLKKISLIFQDSLAILEIDQKKLLQFQESLNQTYFMIENLKLKTYEYLQEQENQRQQLLTLIKTIKNLEENKQPSPQVLKDKVRDISKIVILDPKAGEENPLRTTMNFYREFVYQCEMEIWIKFNRYFSQRRDWVVKTEDEIESGENIIPSSNNNPNMAFLNGSSNICNTQYLKNDSRLNGQRDQSRDKKDQHFGNQSQLETENLHANKYYQNTFNKRRNGEETDSSKQEEDPYIEIERNLDESSEKSEDEDEIDEEDDGGKEEDDEQDSNFEYTQRRRRTSNGSHGVYANRNSQNQQSNMNSYHSQRIKSNSAYHRYHGNNSNHNDYQQSSSHSNQSTGVPKIPQGIRKIRDLLPKEKETILQEYDQTQDIRKISEKYKIKYRRLYNFIQNSRGPNNQSIRLYSDEDKQLIYEDYKKSNNVREVANKWKLNYDSLYSFIRYKKQK